MKKLRLLLLVFWTIVLVMFNCVDSIVAQATIPTAIPNIDQQLIKKVVNEYFDKRYQSQKNLQLADFSSLIANSSTNDDMKMEMRKLDLEAYHSKDFQLQIQQYKFYCYYSAISVAKKDGMKGVPIKAKLMASRIGCSFLCAVEM